MPHKAACPSFQNLFLCTLISEFAVGNGLVTCWIKMLPRCSLKHCKCLFISVLVVCTLTALVAYHFRLVGQQTGSTEPKNRLTAADSSTPVSDEDYLATRPATERVQFLPLTDATPDQADEDKVLKASQKRISEQALEKIANGGPIFYNQQVFVPSELFYLFLFVTFFF